MPRGAAAKPVDGKALARVKGRSERTTRSYRAIIKAFLGSGQPVSPAGFAAYVDGLRGRRAAATVNLAIAAGAKAFRGEARAAGQSENQLVRLDRFLASIPSVVKAPPEVEVLTPEERARLFKALPLRVRLVAETLYVTGGRVAEVLSVRRDRIKVDRSVELSLYGKGGKERRAWIPVALYRRILAEYPAGVYLFETGRGHPFAREYISREIARAARRELGRKGISAHVLRHSRATDMLRENPGRIKAISRMLGHASSATTLAYYVRDAFTEDELLAGLEEGEAMEGAKT